MYEPIRRNFDKPGNESPAPGYVHVLLPFPDGIKNLHCGFFRTGYPEFAIRLCHSCIDESGLNICHSDRQSELGELVAQSLEVIRHEDNQMMRPLEIVGTRPITRLHPSEEHAHRERQ